MSRFYRKAEREGLNLTRQQRSSIDAITHDYQNALDLWSTKFKGSDYGVLVLDGLDGVPSIALRGDLVQRLAAKYPPIYDGGIQIDVGKTYILSLANERLAKLEKSLNEI